MRARHLRGNAVRTRRPSRFALPFEPGRNGRSTNEGTRDRELPGVADAGIAQQRDDHMSRSELLAETDRAATMPSSRRSRGLHFGQVDTTSSASASGSDTPDRPACPRIGGDPALADALGDPRSRTLEHAMDIKMVERRPQGISERDLDRRVRSFSAMPTPPACRRCPPR